MPTALVTVPASPSLRLLANSVVYNERLRTNGWGSHGMVTWNKTDFVAEASSVALSNHLTSAQADTHQRPRWRCIRFERDSQESNHILRLRPIVDQS